MAGGNPITNQATWRLAGPGKDSYIRFPDWSDGVTSANVKKKKKKKSIIGESNFLPCSVYFDFIQSNGEPAGDGVQVLGRRP